MSNYHRVADAIKYINEHAAEQPTLDEIAKAVHLSPYHFHRMFREWAGVTPKDFLQYISLNHAKNLLAEASTIEEATDETGFSSSSRLHDLFVTMEGMTPGEFKNGGARLQIRYQMIESPFGEMIAASTGNGICNLLFIESDTNCTGTKKLERRWPNARLLEESDQHIRKAEALFGGDWNSLDTIKLHIRGSDFQLKVWEALLRIPAGTLASYSDLAARIDKPRAARAVGSAVGNNPVAYLIPCHRIIKKVGKIGDYRWGGIRKQAIIGWESAQQSRERQENAKS